jgi:signal transduction histidine kinase
MRGARPLLVVPSSRTGRLDPTGVVTFSEHVDLLYELWSAARRTHPPANSVVLISNARDVASRIAEVLDGTGSTPPTTILGGHDVEDHLAVSSRVAAELSVLRTVALEWLRLLAPDDRIVGLEQRVNDAVDAAVLAVSPKEVTDDEAGFGGSRTESIERWTGDRVVGRVGIGTLGDDNARSPAVGSVPGGLASAEVGWLAGQLLDDGRSRFVVEQAKGLIAQRFGIPIDRAFMVLYEFAQDQNASVVEIANRLVARSLDADDLHAHVPDAEPEPETVATVTDPERIVSDLHNTIIGRLHIAGLNLHAAIAGADEPSRERIQIALDGLDQTIKDIHSVVFALRQSSGTPDTTPGGASPN